ncbi:MAG: MBOAT family protein [Phycisphaerae bacterium]|nr:MBOAT family protein [Gemmatimonadaceae bacterium]
MLFNSLHYAAFLPIVLIGYFLLADKRRWAWLLAASCYFYAVFVPAYLLILGGTIVVDYFAGLLIERASGKKRRMWLIVSIVANVGVLAVFKYYDFLNHNLEQLWNLFGLSYPVRDLGLLLPVGLSFHTFQAMSYTVEVYRGHQKAERHFGIYALYVMFFPQLVAGPIERPQNMLHQFRERHPFVYHNFTQGLALIAWGLFKKVAIADRLSTYVSAVYDAPQPVGAVPAIVGTVFFAFQIYCDFSGYSDIAIGSAQLMGYRLMTNFRRPYFASSVSEFWTRWHISLSTWFRDYVYIPLGGNRAGELTWYRNLLFTFLLSGLWHGANWTFVVWGGLNGVYLVSSLMTRKLRGRLTQQLHLDRVPGIHRLLQVAFTFTIICVSWVFFRANSMTVAVDLLRSMTGPWHVSDLAKMGGSDLPLAAALIALLLLVEWRVSDVPLPVYLNTRTPRVRWAAVYAISLATILFGVFTAQKAFIYFQF